MNNSFTLHCIPWHARAPMLQEIRTTAYQTGLLTREEVQHDEVDECCPHALVLSECGKAIGCARITPDGKVERMAVPPHADREQIESALLLAALLNVRKTALHS